VLAADVVDVPTKSLPLESMRADSVDDAYVLPRLKVKLAPTSARNLNSDVSTPIE
jgi:hypothetical protein